VITDLGVLKPDIETRELTLVARYENIRVEQIVAATGWPLRVADNVEVVPVPTTEELAVLRDLNERTRIAHTQTQTRRATTVGAV
jgi:glutaconate CoA-transferase subunit B